MKGYLITFEGPDGGGKTTQAKLLDEFLQSSGFPTLLKREPGGTEIGEKLGEIIGDMRYLGIISSMTELFLFLAARAQIASEVVIPALREGKVVILDRFIDSTLAYQGFGRGIDLGTLSFLNDLATHRLIPDLTILLDLPIEEGLKRRFLSGETRVERIDREVIEFHQKARDGYLLMAEEDRSGRWVKLDAQEEVEAIQARIEALTSARLRESGIEPRNELRRSIEGE